jgi:Cof subfamily protein (haloacid dehalogenase superfamily)
LNQEHPQKAPSISLFVSDVDGTVVLPDKSLDPRTIVAAQKIHEAGIALALVSARPPQGLSAVMKQLAIEGPVGAFNGGMIFEPGPRFIKESLISAAATRLAIEVMQGFGLDLWFFTRDHWFINKADGTYAQKESRTVAMTPILVEDFAPLIGQAGKIVGSSADLELVAGCEADLQHRLGENAHAKRSQAYYLDVTPPDADKGAAVDFLARFYGVACENVAVIGDMINDVPMFEKAGHSIAMGNASQEVKQKAQHVSAANVDNGWAEAVETYILPYARPIGARR